jgi:hypothetical protein
MADLVIPYVFAAHTPAQAAQVNADIASIATFLNSTGVRRYQAGSITEPAFGTGQVSTRALQTDAVTNDKLGLSVQSDTTNAGSLLTGTYSDELSITGLTPGTYLIAVSVAADTANTSPIAVRVNIDSGALFKQVSESADAGEACCLVFTTAVNSSITVGGRRASGSGLCAFAANVSNVYAIRIA